MNMKIKKVKKSKLYKCNFTHTDPNGRVYEMSIGKDNGITSKADLVKELKRIRNEIDKFPLDKEIVEDEVEEITLTEKEVEEIENLVEAELDSGNL